MMIVDVTHEVAHHRIEVELSELLEEVEADPVEAEHRLGHDHAAEERAEVERDDRRQRNERVARNVAG